MDTVPDTIEGWYEKASHFENQWQKARAITSRSNRTDKTKKKNYSRPNVRERDPDAMDVDAVQLSKEDRDKYIKEGRCCQDRFFTDLISTRGLGVRGWSSGKTEMLRSVVALPE